VKGARDPLVVTGAVAVLSIGLLWLALAQGWLGDDIGRGADFCEAARDQLVRQPANTLSNGGFVAAGLLVAGRLSRRPQPVDAVLSTSMGTAYAVLVVLLGPGSAAMHASQSAVGGHLDTTSMYLFASFAASYAVARLRGLGGAGFAALFVVLLLACELVGSWSRPVPVVMFAGNLAFGMLLLVAAAIEGVLSRRADRSIDLRWGLAGVAAIVVAFVIWNGAKQGTRFCDPDSLLQGHAAWHLLGAVAAYCLFRLYASERTRPAVRTPYTVARSRPSQ
jgi:hypothetical protein